MVGVTVDANVLCPRCSHDVAEDLVRDQILVKNRGGLQCPRCGQWNEFRQWMRVQKIRIKAPKLAGDEQGEG